MPTPLRWLPLIIVLSSGVAHAGILQTLDGKRIEGEIKFTPEGQLAVTVPGSPKATVVGLDSVLSADFKATGSQPPKSAAPAPAPRWIGRDVGRNARPGSAMLAQGNMLVQASGQDIGGSLDSFHFAYRPLNGDGEVVARLASVEPAERAVKVGLMMRSNIDPASAYAMSLAIPSSGLSLLTRPRPGGPSLQRGPGIGAAGLPLWLKLRRQGNKFTAYSADDGRNWQVLGQEEIEMPASILAGVAVCSRSAIVQCNATFEKLTLTGGVDADKPPDSTTPSAKGILFKSGSFLAGSNPRLPDDATVRINRDRELSFPASEVAAVFLKGRTPEFAEKVSSYARPGAVFENGDFFEGSIREFDHGRVRVSSVLFGMRQFEQRKVQALVFAASAPTSKPSSASRYEIKLGDGSVLRADELKFVKDRLEIGLPAGQSARVAHGDVLELNAGPARFLSLAEVKPAKVEAATGAAQPFLIDATFDGKPLALREQRVERGLTLAAGASLTYALGGQYRTLTVRLGVPAHLLPASPVTFVVLADGQEVHRTASVTSVDDPTSVTLDLSNVQSLTLRVESDTPGLGASGTFADPLLVR